MSLDYFVVIDPDTGAFFGASGAYLLDTRKLSDDELETLNEGADSQRGELAERYGIDLETCEYHMIMEDCAKTDS